MYRHLAVNTFEPLTPFTPTDSPMPDPRDLFKINRQDRSPLYDLIEQNFREQVLAGQMKPGDLLPSEWELADLYGVSRLTVRHALDNLERQGWLDRRPGVGTFITHPSITRTAPSKLSFSQQMRALGHTPGSRQLHIQALSASPQVAYHLGLPENAPVIEILRVRLADGEPVMLEAAYLSQNRFPALTPEMDLSNASLYEFLKAHFQTNIAAVDQTLEPVLLTDFQAGQLEVPPGTPAMLSEVVAYTEDGDPVEYSWSVMRGDRCRFYFRFRRGDANA